MCRCARGEYVKGSPGAGVCVVLKDILDFVATLEIVRQVLSHLRAGVLVRCREGVAMSLPLHWPWYSCPASLWACFYLLLSSSYSL